MLCTKRRRIPESRTAAAAAAAAAASAAAACDLETPVSRRILSIATLAREVVACLYLEEALEWGACSRSARRAAVGGWAPELRVVHLGHGDREGRALRFLARHSGKLTHVFRRAVGAPERAAEWAAVLRRNAATLEAIVPQPPRLLHNLALYACARYNALEYVHSRDVVRYASVARLLLNRGAHRQTRAAAPAPAQSLQVARTDSSAAARTNCSAAAHASIHIASPRKRPEAGSAIGGDAGAYSRPRGKDDDVESTDKTIARDSGQFFRHSLGARPSDERRALRHRCDTELRVVDISEQCARLLPLIDANAPVMGAPAVVGPVADAPIGWRLTRLSMVENRLGAHTLLGILRTHRRLEHLCISPIGYHTLASREFAEALGALPHLAVLVCVEDRREGRVGGPEHAMQARTWDLPRLRVLDLQFSHNNVWEWLTVRTGAPHDASRRRRRGGLQELRTSHVPSPSGDFAALLAESCATLRVLSIARLFPFGSRVLWHVARECAARQGDAAAAADECAADGCAADFADDCDAAGYGRAWGSFRVERLHLNYVDRNALLPVCLRAIGSTLRYVEVRSYSLSMYRLVAAFDATLAPRLEYLSVSQEREHLEHDAQARAAPCSVYRFPSLRHLYVEALEPVDALLDAMDTPELVGLTVMIEEVAVLPDVLWRGRPRLARLLLRAGFHAAAPSPLALEAWERADWAAASPQLRAIEFYGVVPGAVFRSALRLRSLEELSVDGWCVDQPDVHATLVELTAALRSAPHSFGKLARVHNRLPAVGNLSCVGWIVHWTGYRRLRRAIPPHATLVSHASWEPFHSQPRTLLVNAALLLLWAVVVALCAAVFGYLVYLHIRMVIYILIVGVIGGWAALVVVEWSAV